MAVIDEIWDEPDFLYDVNPNDYPDRWNQDFLRAARRGDTKRVQEYVDASHLTNFNFDINYQHFFNDETALIAAAKRGHKETVNVLIHAKADLNLKIRGGDTAVKLAAKNGFKDIVNMLITAGAQHDPEEIKSLLKKAEEENQKIFLIAEGKIVDKTPCKINIRKDSISVIKTQKTCENTFNEERCPLTGTFFLDEQDYKYDSDKHEISIKTTEDRIKRLYELIKNTCFECCDTRAYQKIREGR